MKEVLCGYLIVGKLPEGEYLIKGKGLTTALLIWIRMLWMQHIRECKRNMEYKCNNAVMMGVI